MTLQASSMSPHRWVMLHIVKLRSPTQPTLTSRWTTFALWAVSTACSHHKQNTHVAVSVATAAHQYGLNTSTTQWLGSLLTKTDIAPSPCLAWSDSSRADPLKYPGPCFCIAHDAPAPFEGRAWQVPTPSATALLAATVTVKQVCQAMVAAARRPISKGQYAVFRRPLENRGHTGRLCCR